MPRDYDPRLDILLERTVAAPVERVWAARTVPRSSARVVRPRFALTECEVELRPGGVSRTVMRGETGGELASVGGYLTWNASPLAGDAVAAVRNLKQERGANLLKLGSGEFSRALVEHGLIDEFHI